MELMQYLQTHFFTSEQLLARCAIDAERARPSTCSTPSAVPSHRTEWRAALVGATGTRCAAPTACDPDGRHAWH